MYKQFDGQSVGEHVNTHTCCKDALNLINYVHFFKHKDTNDMRVSGNE